MKTITTLRAFKDLVKKIKVKAADQDMTMFDKLQDYIIKGLKNDK